MSTHRILLYAKPWSMNHELYDEPIVDGFVFTTDHKYLDEASAVIFHMPTLQKDDKILNRCMKKEGQLWVFWSMECEVHYEWQYEPRILDLFELTATYKMDSDIPVTYLYPYYDELLKSEPAPKSEFINAFISSSFDRSKRVKYLQELIKYIDVHSYGKVLNNKQLPHDKGVGTKREIISNYKFSLAFENAIATDYVTEKFFEPLMAGSVPVYLGAPNIEDFAPGDKSYINVNSFSSVKSLADYLLELNNDNEKYKEYFKWKSLPLKDSFTMKTRMNHQPLVKLCTMLKKRLL